MKLRNTNRRTLPHISTKHLCFAAGVVLLLSLVPVLYIARYTYPIQDDFAFSIQTHAAYSQTGSLWQALRAAAAVSAEFYTSWQGSYAACFLFALQPAIFGTHFYAATAWFMLASLLAGSYVFITLLLKRLLNADAWVARLVAIVVCFVSVQQVPNANQSFYWYNGAVYYTFFHGLLLLLLALYVYSAVTVPGKKRIAAIAASTALGFVVAGGNYVSGLVAVLAMGGILAVCIWRKRPWLGLCLPFAVMLAGFVVSMLAPGNSVRQDMQAARPGLMGSMVQSFASVFTYANEWAYLWLGLCLAFLAPFLWRIAGRAVYTFRLPGLVSAGSVCLLAAAMFPHIYATGEVGPERLTNIVFFLFVLLCTGNLLYWLGWLRQRLAANTGPATAEKVDNYCKINSYKALALYALAAVVLLIWPGKLNKPLTSWTAISTIRSGEAAAFGAEMDARYTLAENSRGTALEVAPINTQPALLAYGRIYDDPATWDNAVFAEYFGLQSIRETE